MANRKNISLNLNVQKVQVDQLKLSKARLRKHPSAKIDKIAHSISINGFYNPILMDEHNEVICGEARLAAAKQLGLTEIDVIRITHLSRNQKRALRVMDNKCQEESSWSLDAIMTEVDALLSDGFQLEDVGVDTAEWDALLEKSADPLTGEDPMDAQPPPPNDPITRSGDVWVFAEGHRLACGDSLNETVRDNLLQGASVHAVNIDMPYNVSINKHVSTTGRHREFAMASGQMSGAEFRMFNDKVMRACFSHLAPGRHCHAFMDWRSLHIMTQAGLEAGFDHKNTAVWVKPNGGMGSLYRSRHEMVLVFQKPGGKGINNVQLGKSGRNRTNVWEYPGASSFSATRQQDLADHPTVKNVVMIEDAIKDVTNRGEIVLDLFGGSGTTLLAAQRCGRIARLIEIDPTYVDVAIRRYSEAFGSVPVLEGRDLTYDQVKAQRADDTSSQQPNLRTRTRKRLSRGAA